WDRLLSAGSDCPRRGVRWQTSRLEEDCKHRLVGCRPPFSPAWEGPERLTFLETNRQYNHESSSSEAREGREPVDWPGTSVPCGYREHTIVSRHLPVSVSMTLTLVELEHAT